MKARKISYWIGLFCLAMLVLMPDITVNAQPDPGGQGTDGQIPDEVGQGSDTQTSEGQQPPEEQQPSEGQGSSSLEQLLQSKQVEQSLIESGCQQYDTLADPTDGSVWNEYECPPGSIDAHESFLRCLVTPEALSNPEAPDIPWLKRGECVFALVQQSGILEGNSKENGQSPREINVKKIREGNVQQIPEPASSDSQGENDQQQANGEVAQVDEEEAQGEENNASNQSQANNSSKQGYGCSANP